VQQPEHVILKMREGKLRRDKNCHTYRHTTRATCKGKKVKFTIQWAMRAQKGSRGIALLFL